MSYNVSEYVVVWLFVAYSMVENMVGLSQTVFVISTNEACGHIHTHTHTHNQLQYSKSYTAVL